MWSDGWTPESITKLRWFVNIRSIHEAEVSSKCVASFNSWCRPWNEEITSNCILFIDVLSSSHQVGDQALKSAIIWCVIAFIKSTIKIKIFSNWSLFWLGDLYATAIKPLQFSMDTSQRMQLLQADKLMILTPKDSL